MSVDGNNTHQPLKRRRLLTSTSTTTDIDTMEVEAAKAKMEEVKENFGRDLRVFETSPALSSSPSQVSNDEETEGFYEFMPKDYHRILATKKQGEDTAALSSGPFLGEEIMSLKHLDAVTLPADPVQNAPEPEAAPAAPDSAPQYPKLTEKKPAKPKWFKM